MQATEQCSAQEGAEGQGDCLVISPKVFTPNHVVCDRSRIIRNGRRPKTWVELGGRPAAKPDVFRAAVSQLSQHACNLLQWKPLFGLDDVYGLDSLRSAPVQDVGDAT